MDAKQEKKLMAAFPLLYAAHLKGYEQDSYFWGFNCEEGWCGLLWSLSEKLEPLIREWCKQHPGKQLPQASKVKEKFAVLRYHLTLGDAKRGDPIIEKMLEQVDWAEKQSAKICEWCGNAGEYRNMTWKKTLCNEHFALWEQGKRPWEEKL